MHLMLWETSGQATVLLADRPTMGAGSRRNNHAHIAAFVLSLKDDIVDAQPKFGAPGEIRTHDLCLRRAGELFYFTFPTSIIQHLYALILLKK